MSSTRKDSAHGVDPAASCARSNNGQLRLRRRSQQNYEHIHLFDEEDWNRDYGLLIGAFIPSLGCSTQKTIFSSADGSMHVVLRYAIGLTYVALMVSGISSLKKFISFLTNSSLDLKIPRLTIFLVRTMRPCMASKAANTKPAASNPMARLPWFRSCAYF